MKAKNFDIVPHSLSHLNQIACIAVAPPTIDIICEWPLTGQAHHGAISLVSFQNP